MYIHEFRVRNQKKFVSFTSSSSTIIGENSTEKTNLFYSLRHLFDKNLMSRLSSNEFPDCIESIELNSDLDSNKATYSLIFKPKKFIKSKISFLSKELYSLQTESEKLEKTTKINNYNNSPDEVKKKEKIYSRSFSSSDWKVCGEKI